MSEQWPATTDAYHDARDDGVIPLSPEEIEAYAEVLRRPLVEPAPIVDPVLLDRTEAGRVTDMNARAELHRRIVRRLSTDEWMERHFGIVCHAGDVADAVLELFPDVEVTREFRGPGWVIGANGPAFDDLATHTRYVLRTAPDPVLADRTEADE